MDANELIATCYLDAVAEVVEFYSGHAPVSRPADDAGRGGTAAVVGFADAELRGSSILLGEEAAILALAPQPGSDPRDWLGELNNQIVGRLKNKLVAADRLLQMSPPVTVDGAGLRLGALHARTTNWVVEWPGGALRAALALTVPEGLTLTLNGAAEVAEEGSLSLF